MIPTSPVIPGRDLVEVVYAKDQTKYQPLPALRFPDGVALSRWKLTWRERLQVLFRGNFFLAVWTFNQPLQPLLPSTEEPNWADYAALERKKPVLIGPPSRGAA